MYSAVVDNMAPSSRSILYQLNQTHDLKLVCTYHAAVLLSTALLGQAAFIGLDKQHVQAVVDCHLDAVR